MGEEGEGECLSVELQNVDMVGGGTRGTEIANDELTRRDTSIMS